MEQEQTMQGIPTIDVVGRIYNYDYSMDKVDNSDFYRDDYIDKIAFENKCYCDLFVVQRDGNVIYLAPKEVPIDNILTIKKKVYFTHHNSRKNYDYLTGIFKEYHYNYESGDFVDSLDVIQHHFLYYCTINPRKQFFKLKKEYHSSTAKLTERQKEDLYLADVRPRNNYTRYEYSRYERSNYDFHRDKKEIVARLRTYEYVDPDNFYLFWTDSIKLDDIKKLGGTVYIKSLDIVVSTNPDVKPEVHPNMRNNSFVRNELYKNINGIMVYIIDNSNSIGNRYMRIGESVFEVRATTSNNPNKKDGLYIEKAGYINLRNNEIVEEKTDYYKPDQLDELKWLHRNMVEALNSPFVEESLAHIENQAERDFKQYKLEAEKEKEQMRFIIKEKELEIKLMDAKMKEQDAELANIKNKGDLQLYNQKNKNERFKGIGTLITSAIGVVTAGFALVKFALSILKPVKFLKFF